MYGNPSLRRSAIESSQYQAEEVGPLQPKAMPGHLCVCTLAPVFAGRRMPSSPVTHEADFHADSEPPWKVTPTSPDPSSIRPNLPDAHAFLESGGQNPVFPLVFTRFHPIVL